MTIDREIEAFRRITKDLLETEEITAETPIGLVWPRALFATAINSLKRGTSLTKEEFLLLAKEFLTVLDKMKVEISDKDKDYFLGKKLKGEKKRDWKTKRVWRDAFGHEKAQPRDAY